MTIALSLATFMQVLDSTIANVAIPTIAGNLGSSLSRGLGYHLLRGGECHLNSDHRLAGKTRRGSEAVPVVDGGVRHRLLGLRDVQQPDDADFLPRDSGIVAGPLIPLSQSLLLSNYPPAKRSIALALWSMTVIVAPICGPILGGYISDNYHWGWIFFINVPIGIAVVVMTLQTLRAAKPVPNSGGLTALAGAVGDRYRQPAGDA